MKNQTRNLVLTGILSSLAVVFMIISITIPTFGHVIRWFSGAIILIILYETNIKTTIIASVTVTLISIIFIPNLFIPIDFILLKGSYPIVRIFLNKINNKKIRMSIKSIYFMVYSGLSLYISFVFFANPNIIRNIERFGYIFLLINFSLGIFYASWYDWFWLKYVDIWYKNKLKNILNRN
ncbi:MAG: hypothetical protein FWF57_01290 [Defluviitaleaceae bacterium]|nr:hypothetical protein [Defluviitaleaceae bacterium]